MKREKSGMLVSLFILGILSTGLMAEKCERLITYSGKYIADSIADDLESSLWSSDLLGDKATLFFFEQGVAESIQVSGDEPHIKVMSWNVHMCDGQAILTLSAPDGSSRSFLIDPTCDGFAVRDAFGRRPHYLNQEAYGSGQQTLTRNQIIGTWRTEDSNARKMREMSWNFDKDGTFSIAVAPDMYHAVHQGVWDISNDGQYLILYFMHADNPESVYTAELIAIKSVDFEDMIIDGSTLPAIIGDTQKDRLLSFVKKHSS